MWNEGLEGPALDIAGSDANRLLVDAGPGAGKTFALMRRVCRLLEDEGVAPEKIFVGTFTRTSATDLKAELTKLETDGVEAVYAGTLHAFCFGLLSRDDVFEQTQRIPRPLLKFEERFLLEDLRGDGFGGIKAKRERLEAFNTQWARLQTDDPGWLGDPVDRIFQNQLSAWLRFHNAIHIGELIWLAYDYLRNNPESEFRGAFEHVLVDEYQDLNRAEQVLIDLLAEAGKLTVIGDEDQSIYSFRYAHPDGMRDFSDRHDEIDIRSLEQCRRCPHAIIDMANELIARNQNRKDRQLEHFPGNEGGDVAILQWPSIEDEAEGLARIIECNIQEGTVSAGDVLVLSPRRQFGYAVRDSLTRRGIAAHSFFAEEELEGHPSKSDRNQAQKAFVLLGLCANPHEPTALRCWCGFDGSTLYRGGWEKIREHCEETGLSLHEALEQLVAGNLEFAHTAPIIAKYQALREALGNLNALQGQALVDAIFPEAQAWAEPLRALLDGQIDDESDAAAVYNTLRSAITQPELPTDVDYVRVMSLHKSKGLTAKFVIVCGCIEGLIPTFKKDATQNEQAVNIEEQRRLFYVAITRAKQHLILSQASQLPFDVAQKMRARTRYGNNQLARTISSQFLGELGGARPNAQRGADYLRQLGV